MPCDSSARAVPAQSLQAMQCVRDVTGSERLVYLSPKSWSCADEVGLERRRRVVAAVRGDVQRDLVALRGVGRGLRVGQGRVRIHVRRAADALPLGHVAAGRARRVVGVEARRDAAGRGMVVAGQDHRGLHAAREVPEPGQRLLVGGHRAEQVREQPLLLVGLGDRDLGQVHPVGLVVTGGRAVEQVVGADRRRAVALLARPGGIALAREHDGAREVVGERRGAPAVGAHVAHRQRGGRRRRGAVRVERREARGAGERVAVGGAVELHRVGDDAGAGRTGGVDAHVGVGERRARVGEAEQAGELLVGPHGDQVAAAVHPGREHRDLRGGERHVAEDRRVMRREHGRGDVRDVGHLERVQALRTQDLGVVAGERVGGLRDHQDRAAGSLVGAGPGRRRGRERPAVVGGEGVAGAVLARRRRRP